MNQDPFSILGVSPDASEDEIKKAYRKLCRKYHPDVGGDANKFDELTKAYDMICNNEVKVIKKVTIVHDGLFKYKTIMA